MKLSATTGKRHHTHTHTHTLTHTHTHTHTHTRHVPPTRLPQAWKRGYTVRTILRRDHRNATVIQRAFRRHFLEPRTRAVVSIQSRCRVRQRIHPGGVRQLGANAIDVASTVDLTTLDNVAIHMWATIRVRLLIAGLLKRVYHVCAALTIIRLIVDSPVSLSHPQIILARREVVAQRERNRISKLEAARYHRAIMIVMRIQATFRAKKTRKYMRHLERSCATVQAKLRGWLWRRRMVMRAFTSTEIQRVWRGYSSRTSQGLITSSATTVR